MSYGGPPPGLHSASLDESLLNFPLYLSVQLLNHNTIDWCSQRLLIREMVSVVDFLQMFSIL